MEAAGTSICLVMKAVLLSARWAGQSRRLGLEQAAEASGDVAELHAENVVLRDTVEFLIERLACAQRRLKAANIRTPYSPAERLHILWCVEYFGIPRRRIPEYLGVARSTVWRWLRRLQDGIGLCGRRCQASMRRTAEQLERLVWLIRDLNPQWGRRRIAMVLGTLDIFLAASTVRNILLRPKPRTAPAATRPATQQQMPRQVVARYPNRVWSVDRTRVWRWGVWPTWVLVAVDHHSRMVTAARPLEGPNAGWVMDVLEAAFVQHGVPKHIITDQEGVFVGDVFAELLRRRNVKQRFGAVGKHGSIAVTERAIWTLKYEWLTRVPVIRGLDHLAELLGDFELWYNDYRGHMRLGGARPSAIHRGERWERPDRSAKALPRTIQRRVFPDVRITAYQLAA